MEVIQEYVEVYLNESWKIAYYNDTLFVPHNYFHISFYDATVFEKQNVMYCKLVKNQNNKAPNIMAKIVEIIVGYIYPIRQRKKAIKRSLSYAQK